MATTGGDSTAVDDRAPDGFRLEADRVTPLGLEPEVGALPKPEQDAPLELERRPIPPRAENHLALVRRESDQDGRDQLSDRDSRVVHHTLQR